MGFLGLFKKKCDHRNKKWLHICDSAYFCEPCGTVLVGNGSDDVAWLRSIGYTATEVLPGVTAPYDDGVWRRGPIGRAMAEFDARLPIRMAEHQPPPGLEKVGEIHDMMWGKPGVVGPVRQVASVYADRWAAHLRSNMHGLDGMWQQNAIVIPPEWVHHTVCTAALGGVGVAYYLVAIPPDDTTGWPDMQGMADAGKRVGLMLDDCIQRGRCVAGADPAEDPVGVSIEQAMEGA